MKLKAGSKISELSTHEVTKHQGLRGPGVVTAVRYDDPVNKRYTVWVKTASGKVAVTIKNVKGIQ